MPISETIEYTLIFGLTVIFTVFAIVLKEGTQRLIMKVIAGILWFVMAVAQFLIGDITSALTLSFALLCGTFSTIFFLSTVLDWFGEKKSRFARSIEE